MILELSPIPESEKGYQCSVLLDSITPSGCRLTTMRVKYPLIIHSECCRHRCFSRSVASNRAIPTEKILQMVDEDPFVPAFWGKNQSGMQAQESLTGDELWAAKHIWDKACKEAHNSARALARFGLHKQLANRILAPFQWVTEVISATDWDNFFAQRMDAAAAPEMRTIAEMILVAYDASIPIEKQPGEWHIPFIQDEEVTLVTDLKLKISAARCARTSYRTHSGKISGVEEDLALYERLMSGNPKHVSPCEHQAEASPRNTRFGNFLGWKQFRYFHEGHTCWSYVRLETPHAG